MKKIKPKSWDEVFAEADKAGDEGVVVDGSNLPRLKSVYPRREWKPSSL